MRKCAAVLSAVLTLVPLAVQAQERALRSFVGVGMLAQTDDTAHRSLFAAAPPVRPMPHLEFGIPIRSFIGIDVAVTRIQAVSGGGVLTNPTALRDTVDEREQETLIHGAVRGRLARRGSVAFDVVGGAGLTIEHGAVVRTTCRVLGRIPVCADSKAPAYRRSAAFLGGFDIPVEVGGHAEISPVVRLVRLQRGGVETDIEHREPSVKGEFGMVLRGFW
jgi:hypothetical protein